MQELNCDENMQGQFLRFLRTLKGTYLFNQGLLLAGIRPTPDNLLRFLGYFRLRPNSVIRRKSLYVLKTL
jgi:hypothetical protein